MKKLLTGIIAASMLSLSAQVAHASDAAAIVGGIILGSIITNHHNHKQTVITPPNVVVLQPPTVVHRPVIVHQPAPVVVDESYVQYSLCPRTIYVRPKGWTTVYFYCVVQ